MSITLGVTSMPRLAIADPSPHNIAQCAAMHRALIVAAEKPASSCTGSGVN